MKRQSLLLFAEILPVRRRVLGRARAGGNEQVYSARHQHHAGECPAEFNACFTCQETGTPSDKLGDEIWSWLGEKQGEGKIRRFCYNDGISYGVDLFYS